MDHDYVAALRERHVAWRILRAGVTTYSPLTRWGAGPGKKVGVVGVGGLGHMAVQIAAAMGAEVTGIDLDLLLKLLKNRGALVDVGLPEHPSEINVSQLIAGNKVLTGSNIGGIPETQEVLDFCAEHQIAPWVEVIGGKDINDAYDNVVGSQVRYRYVIDTSTFDD